MQNKYLRNIAITLIALQIGCATGQSSYNNRIIGGLVGGAAVGALAGSALTGNDATSDQRTRNTIISSIVFSLLAGGAMAWHHREIEQAKLEVSGRYSRYRLCDPDELRPEILKQFEFNNQREGAVYKFDEAQLGDLAISLDDNTKWVYPDFRKRYLLPERGENQVISERYIWEIVKPGSFVTRSQNPEYFYEGPPKQNHNRQ